MTYCGEHISLRKTPKLVPQIKSIADALDEANIKLISKNVARDRLLIHNGILKLIDFEDCLPEGEDTNMPGKDVIQIYGEDFVNLRRERHSRALFEKELRRAVLYGRPWRPKAHERETT